MIDLMASWREIAEELSRNPQLIRSKSATENPATTGLSANPQNPQGLDTGCADGPVALGEAAQTPSVVSSLQERLLAGNWSDGPDAPWTDQRQRFCVHLFGCTDCSHPENIHCPTGARLLAAYRDNLTIH